MKRANDTNYKKKQQRTYNKQAETRFRGQHNNRAYDCSALGAYFSPFQLRILIEIMQIRETK